MNRNQRNALQRRSGFTLIEILIVIAIIAILSSLLLGAIMLVRGKGPAVKTRNDILQLSEGIQKFKTKFGFYPPDQIRLRSSMASYNPPKDGLDVSSVAILNSMWPNLSQTTAILWAGETPIPAAGVVLDGDQCLVFFLGGIPNGAGAAPVGFSTNPVNPAAPGGDRIKFLDFDVARVQIVHAGSPFPSFLDGYSADLDAVKKKPYIYFSSNKRKNGYDASANSWGVSPYMTQAASGVLPAQYWMADSYQIISAGPDGAFGPGGLWTAANYTTMPVVGHDDVSNFSDRQLGVGP